MIPVLVNKYTNLVSTIACGVARTPQLASSTPGRLLQPLVHCAIHTSTAVARIHVRNVHLDQWQIALHLGSWFTPMNMTDCITNAYLHTYGRQNIMKRPFFQDIDINFVIYIFIHSL